ncbi:MAG: motile sperm domain-containing protein [Bacteroidales bacterium]|nr:motile sperm domain-containing protein [Bacteroidales bacterium]
MRGLLITLILAVFMLQGIDALAQSASVSPSRLYFDVPLGEAQQRELKVTNNSNSPQAFQISFADFESPGIEGKTAIMKQGESEHSCSEWLVANPSFIELGPNESKDISILMEVPNKAEAKKAAWATILVKLARERKSGEDMQEGYGFGINQTFQFVVHVFQQPPSVNLKKGEIYSFKEKTSPQDSSSTLEIQFKNTGEAILDCAAYTELTYLKDGSTQRLKVRAFTVLPDGARRISFDVPEDLKPGEYSVLGVVDYGSDEEVQAAEISLEVPE